MEPEPRPDGLAPERLLPPWQLVTNWPRQVSAPAVDFLSVLNARRSRVGGPLGELELASVLRHSTMLRARRLDGRFGAWESRSAPAAGGLHGIALLALPCDATCVAGMYDDRRHGLVAPASLLEALRLNRDSVASIALATDGITLQLVADRSRYDACYSSPETLMWRDAGALCSIITLVATALSLASIVLGRRGDAITQAATLDAHWVGVGAVHIGG